MGRLFDRLDREWSVLGEDLELVRQTRDELALAGHAPDWRVASVWMRSPDVSPAEKNEVLTKLIRRAALDADLAASRILVALLMPGIVSEIERHRRRPNAFGCSEAEIEAEAIEAVWRLICTYPTHRPGSVAANVLLDLRKQLCRRPLSVPCECVDALGISKSIAFTDEEPEVDVLGLVVIARQADRITHEQAQLIVDRRILGIGSRDAANNRRLSERTFCRRERAAEQHLIAYAREEFAA